VSHSKHCSQCASPACTVPHAFFTQTCFVSRSVSLQTCELTATTALPVPSIHFIHSYSVQTLTNTQRVSAGPEIMTITVTSCCPVTDVLTLLSRHGVICRKRHSSLHNVPTTNANTQSLFTAKMVRHCAGQTQSPEVKTAGAHSCHCCLSG
jgi:hypothetical protein